MSYLISIVIPLDNASQYIGAAVDSVRRQTFADGEPTVVDDGSTDDGALDPAKLGLLDETWASTAILGEALDAFSPGECANYFRSCGYSDTPLQQSWNRSNWLSATLQQFSHEFAPLPTRAPL